MKKKFTLLLFLMISLATYAQIKLDLNSGSATLETFSEFGFTEFIQTDHRENLANHRFALMLSGSGTAETHGFNRLLLIDRITGRDAHFETGKTEILEEHLIVPKSQHASDFWIIGTTLDWARGNTNLYIYEGSHLADGPIMKAELDMPLPLGLHGHFVKT